MPGTVKDIITRAMRILGVIEQGEAPSAAEAADGLVAFRGLLDIWSVEGLVVYVDTTQTFGLSTTKRTYVWGAGGDFNAAPPLSIVSAWFNDGGSTDFEVKDAGANHHAAVMLKDIVSRPEFYWADKDATSWTIRFDTFPIDPSISFITRAALGNTQALTEATGFPMGFDSALAYNLAIHWSPEFGVEPTPNTRLLARDYKRTLDRFHVQIPMMRPDPAVAAKGRSYNIESGPA